MTKKRVEFLKNKLSCGQAALITSDANRFYLTGFNSSAGLIFVTPDSADLLIDFRYFEKAKATVENCETVLLEKTGEQLKALCSKYNIKRVLVETCFVSIGELERYKKMLPEVEIDGDDTLDRLLEEQRSVKTEAELSLIRKAQEYTDRTFEYILNNIRAGRTERDVMLDMEFYMRKLGSEGVAFDFIVVSGKNSSLPHGVPTDKPIENGDFVTMDFGAVAGGYRSDMTRTVAVGSVNEEQRRVYETVLKAQLSAIDAVVPGVDCCEVDKVARDIIYSAGYEGCFGHGLGHSVGIEIHENPSFNTRCHTRLKPGTVMTVEPGIYLENKFGVRIEDMVYVTADGCIDLTGSSKELIVLP